MLTSPGTPVACKFDESGPAMILTPDLLLAHADGARPWPAEARPVPEATPDPVAAAYQLQLATSALRRARGEQPRGFKIGFTNRTIWDRYRVHAPIWGPVWSTTLHQADGEGRLSLAGTCEPRIEPEIVFGLRARPADAADLPALFEAIDWLAPGFEVVQTHRPGWVFTAPDCVADGSLHARLLVGRRTPVRTLAADAAALHALLATAEVELARDGQPVERGRGANVLDSPLMALRHFLRELRACPGAPDLQAGDVITTGTWTDAWPVQPGTHWQATFSAGLGRVALRFDDAA